MFPLRNAMGSTSLKRNVPGWPLDHPREKCAVEREHRKGRFGVTCLALDKGTENAAAVKAITKPSIRATEQASNKEDFRREIARGMPRVKEEQSEKGAWSEEAAKTDSSDEMGATINAVRSRLNRRLSEANMYNRFLMREIQYREEAIRETKHVLAALLTEMQEVASGVEELCSTESFIPPGFVSQAATPTALKAKLKELTGALEKQLSGVDALKLREVPLSWIGMAEDVKVMGSFDGWTYGEHLSPEFTGSETRFTTVLKLRPGRYEVKFVVDGEWRVAPQWPTVGHGMTENNVLIVD